MRIIAFDGGWNLPLWAGRRQGFFEANGVDIALEFTPNSGALVAGLAAGRYDLALAGLENFVAYQAGQGEAQIQGEADFVAVMGGDSGFLSVVAAPDVTRLDELRGRTLSVDAMTTGFAFVLRELLGRAGIGDTEVEFVRAGGTPNRYRDLIAGKHAATLLRTPFELLARARGCHVLATAAALGPYQGSVAAVRRDWARANEAALVGFIRAYRAALDWLYDRAHRAIAAALLVAHMRDMTPALAAESCDLLLAEPGGLVRDAGIDWKGVETVLALRSKYGTPHKDLAGPARYIDTSYWDRAARP
jgi:ABC-type nitrate/sulfonate/bicarbonate transport system substrate-binding protein